MLGNEHRDSYLDGRTRFKTLEWDCGTTLGTVGFESALSL